MMHASAVVVQALLRKLQVSDAVLPQHEGWWSPLLTLASASGTCGH